MAIKIKLINPDEIWERLSSGKTYDEDFNIYTRAEIESCIRQFLLEEEYEKCAFLDRYLKNLKFT
jgi:hypothetical protein